MITLIRRTGVIILISVICLLAGYTALAGIWFSMDEMWQSETGLMIGYSIVFAITASLMVLFAKKDWIQEWMG